jgi:hypothetical protein
LTQVKAHLETGGDLKVVQEGKVAKLKMSVVADMAYDEMRFAAEPEHQSGLRFYRQAEATIKVDQGGAKPTLPDERRLIGVTWGPSGTLLYSPTGSLTREQLDLIDLPGNSLLIDALLPEAPVAKGESWQHPDKLLASLLGVDAISKNDVASVLKEVEPGRTATIEINGQVEAAVEGVGTKIELKGRYTYDFSAGRIASVTLLIKEDRAIGHVATGLDVTARLQLSIATLAVSRSLTADVLEKVTLDADPASHPLSYRSSTADYRLQLDRRWHAVNDDPKLLTLRFVDRGDLIAQCNVAPLQRAAAGEHVTLSHFQGDIQKALGDKFGQFVKASEGTDDRGRVRYRVVVTGLVAELPIQWNYHLIADEQGRQAAFAFTLEEGLVERFADADKALVDALEFVEPSTAQQPTPARK